MTAVATVLPPKISVAKCVGYFVKTTVELSREIEQQQKLDELSPTRDHNPTRIS